PRLQLLWEKGSLDRAEDSFERLGSAVIWAGFVSVADSRSLGVYQYKPGGDFQGIMGRRGSGPGEFRSITGLTMIADTLFVADGRRRHVTGFLGGQSVSEQTVDIVQRAGFAAGLQARLTGGRLLVAYRPATIAAETFDSEPVRLVVLGPDGSMPTELGPIRRPRTNIELQFRASQLTINAPGLRRISTGTILGFSSNGRVFAHADADFTGKVLRIQSWDLMLSSEARTGILRFDPETVRDASIDSIAIDLVRSDPEMDEAQTGLVRRVIREQIRPTFYPPVTGLVAANTGELWFRLNGPAIPMETWLRYDPSSGASLRIRLKPLEIVAAADGDLIVTTRPTPDGIPKLALYRVIK
ncbi:MAG: hypothetical protein ACREMA_13325, partial [Longimicrobiales bacterium]